MKKIILILSLLPVLLYSQTVYEPMHRDIYEFLGRLAQKGVIEFNDEIKPVSKNYIAEKLYTIDNLKFQLTHLELVELEFYKKDFGFELPSLNEEYKIAKKGEMTTVGQDPKGRYRLFSYKDDLFRLNISPILGYQLGIRNGESYSHRWGGISLYGYLTNNIGFSFDFRDNSENGFIDSLNTLNNTTGKLHTVNKRNNNGRFTVLEYSEVQAHLTYSWDWGHIAIGKEFLNWGYGENGNIVLSRKAPSFPFIKYDITPASWLRFNYSHSWLSSDEIDSTDLYRTSTPKGGGEYRLSYRRKYFVSHSFIITPLKGLSVSLGESIIYSDNFEPIYLIPLMFFRLADHYVGSKYINPAGGNSQFFASLSSRNHIKNTHLYGTVFIDEINTYTFGKPAEEKTQIGFTLGASIVDIPFRNLKLSFEYTKIYPFVYMHYIPTQTYQNASFNMGHWIGSNADMIYAALQYRILRGLSAKLWAQAIRKGDEGNPEMQHTLPQAPFLFGLRKNYISGGAEVKYEITHELFVRCKCIYNKNEVQQENKSFEKKSFNEFYIAVYYGL